MRAKKRMFRLGAGILMTLLFLSSANAQVTKNKKNQERTKSDLEAEKYFIEGEKYFILEDYSKAQALFKKALEEAPDNPAIHYKLAETLMHNNDLSTALSHAGKAVELNGQNKYYYLLKAEVFKKQHNYEGAIDTYEELVKNVKGTEKYLFELGSLYVFNKNYDDALDVFNRAESHFGVSDQISFQKQKILLKQNRLDEAIEEGEKLIRNHPGETEYILALVEILVSNERSSEATEYLEQALELDPSNYRARFLLAQIYLREEKTDKARENIQIAFSNPEMDLNLKVQVILEELKKISGETDQAFVRDLAEMLVKTHPDAGIAYAVYGDLHYSMEEFEASKTKYHKAIELGENNYAVWQNILQIEISLEQYDSVIIHADKALELYPNQAFLYYFSGTAHLIQKNYEEAAAVFELGKKYAASNLQLLSIIYGQLGDAYNGLENYAKSDEAYEAALDANPNNDHVLNNYSYYLSLRKEKLELAKKMSTKLVKNNPDNPNYLDTHAWVLYMTGDYEQAKKYIEKALKSDVNGTIIEHYGDILYKLGDVDGAVKQWQKAKGMDETTELIDKKIADRKLYE